MSSIGQSQVNEVLNEVQIEIEMAMFLHPPMASRHEAKAVIEEELDEFWDEVKLNPNKMSQQSRQLWKWRMRQELVQIAAMAVRSIVDLDLFTLKSERS
jgi:hypothetical protein